MIQNGVLRIVCISDTHEFHRKLALPPGDILIHAGDCLPDDRQAEALEDFDDWLGGLPFRHRIVVAGNHDLYFARQPQQARKQLTKAVYLENTGVVIEGLRVWGCPITPVPEHMAFAVKRGAE